MRGELVERLRPCFARVEPWLQAGKYVAVVMGDLPRFKPLATTVEPAGGTLEPTGPQVFSVDLSSA